MRSELLDIITSRKVNGEKAHKLANDNAPRYGCAALAKKKTEDAGRTPILAQEPRILDRMAQELERSGLVGVPHAAKLVYLVLTSRFLDRPLCAVIKGQSSSGKSYLIERMMKLFPENAYHFMTSMSPKALAYIKAPLVHRILVVAEAAGFRKGDDALLLRSLISEGRIHHETVDKEGKALVLDQKGPTGLLVTTTAPLLDAELETRMLSIPINDSPEQIRAIVKANAAHWDGSGSLKEMDPAPWHGLQTWLEGAEHEVVIPYVGRLAELMSSVPFGRHTNEPR